MDGDIKDDSIYSLGCQLCHKFSSQPFSNESDSASKYHNFVTSSEKDKKQKNLLQKNKRMLFSILLKKTHNQIRNDYQMPVTDKFYATAFELENSNREESAQKLLKEFSKLSRSNSNVDKVLQFLLQLKNIHQYPCSTSTFFNMGISISKYGNKNGFYTEYPSELFSVKLTNPNCSRYKQFTPEMFQKQLPYKNLLTLETKLGVDYDVIENTPSSKIDPLEPHPDEGYSSPGPSDRDIWDECMSVEGCKRMTWESLGKRTFQTEKPFLSESETSGVHNIWRLGKSLNLDAVIYILLMLFLMQLFKVCLCWTQVLIRSKLFPSRWRI